MKNNIYYLSVFITFLSIWYISWINWILQFIFFIIFYSLVLYLLYFLYKKIRRNKILDYKIFLINFIKKISLSIIIISIFIWAFWYYQNNISPATMSEYTISNWEKTLVFQEMSHIWSDNFYNTIKNKLTDYKKQDFVYFYEWVKPGTPENMDKFNKALWIDFNPELYKNFSKLYWVTFQDNSIYYNLVNNLDFNVDVWIDWIIEEYEKPPQTITKPLSWTLSPSQEKEATNPIDINSEIINALSRLNEKQLKILVFINKSILNSLIKSESAQKLISSNFANQRLFDIILNWRNEVLTKEIINSEYNKIYTTYWKLHFSGVLKLLQKNDKNWKIIKQKEIICLN